MNYSDERAREIALTWYGIWARDVLIDKSFKELQEIGQICSDISGEYPLHLGLEGLGGKKFDIDEVIKQVTPLQVIALMYVVLEIVSDIPNKLDWLKESNQMWRLFSLMRAEDES